MPTLLAICNASLLLPLFLLPLIPAEYDQLSGVGAIAPGTSEPSAGNADMATAGAHSSISGGVLDDLALSEAGRTVSIPGAEQHAHHHFATHFSDTFLTEALATDHAAIPAPAAASVTPAAGLVSSDAAAGSFHQQSISESDGEPAVVAPAPASGSLGATTLELRVALKYRQQREQRFLQRQRRRQYALAVRSMSVGPSDSFDRAGPNNGHSSGTSTHITTSAIGTGLSDSSSSGNGSSGTGQDTVEGGVVVLPAAPLVVPSVVMPAEGNVSTVGTQPANNIVPSWIVPSIQSSPAK
jgi:hypothetical protein